LKIASTAWRTGSRFVSEQNFLSDPPWDVLHHDVLLVLLDHRVVHADDVGVVELAGEGRLVEEELLEALRLLLAHVRVLLGELDGHLAVVERVLGEIDHGRRALAEVREHGVLADLVGAFGHVDP
jgi:hypothetical protein